MVVDLYRSGSLVKDLTSEYGVSEVTIYKWIKKFSPIDLEDGSFVTPNEIINLQKQMRRLQEELESDISITLVIASFPISTLFFAMFTKLDPAAETLLNLNYCPFGSVTLTAMAVNKNIDSIFFININFPSNHNKDCDVRVNGLTLTSLK
ncbi:hypothetical protein COE25_15905 [Bacillus sp. AFS031507]|nr:hypothetical protein COE25_15905 [Bacillus sp. AFS031507]